MSQSIPVPRELLERMRATFDAIAEYGDSGMGRSRCPGLIAELDELLSRPEVEDQEYHLLMWLANELAIEETVQENGDRRDKFIAAEKLVRAIASLRKRPGAP